MPKRIPERARQRLARRVAYWSERLKVTPRFVRVQYMARKWGSCSSDGIVSLAGDLDRREQGFQDFVIVHELLHLRVGNHGRVFKALMNAHLPGWRTYERQRVAGESGYVPSGR